MKRAAVLLAVAAAALIAARMCHAGIVWAEEALPLAAAAQMKLGRVLYRDLWFDKPPLLAWIYLAWGAQDGWPLRLAGAIHGWIACGLAWLFARDLWGEREAMLAAGLLAFFLIFGIPSAVTPLAADLLMLVPHLAAVWLAHKGRSLASGAAAGIAFLINPKGLIVAAVCGLWNPGGLVLFATGFLIVNAAGMGYLAAAGALDGYIDQVWKWGRVYSGRTFVAEPWHNAALRSLNWAGFHAVLVVGTVMALRERSGRWKWIAWLALSGVAVAAGMRFFPRYFFQLLPVVVLLGARGLAQLPRRCAWAVALLLLIPAARFGPRYALLAMGRSAEWADTAMDRDSREAARIVRSLARPGDTIFVWGFRPELYCYTGLAAASRFLDSQPLTGVPADRHLTDARAVDPAIGRPHRAELARTRPEFILDGLGVYNPALQIKAFPDLSEWLGRYHEVGRSGQTVIFRRY